jgi:uncharacterized UPF0146 family protein
MINQKSLYSIRKREDQIERKLLRIKDPVKIMTLTKELIALETEEAQRINNWGKGRK